jgi:hypothetical protein
MADRSYNPISSRRNLCSRKRLYSVKLSAAGETVLHNRIVVVISAFLSILGAGMDGATAQTSTGQSIRSEPFEGLWAKTKEECLDGEGPNSRTMIDFRNAVGGKSTPIFDQYENHCLVERKNVVGNDVTLNVTCFEFWEYFTKRIEGTKGIIKLTLGRNRSLTIDGQQYQYCANQPAQANAASAAERQPSKETYEQGRAWEEQIRNGACTRLRDRRTDSPADVAECTRIYSQQPLCKSYSGFAYAWFGMANDPNPQISSLDWTTKVIDSLGTNSKNSDPEYYQSEDYHRMLHRLAKVIFSPDRSRWKTNDETRAFAYKICIEGHAF